MTVEFAELLKRHRERSGLTQQELADRAGISVAAVRDLEQARSRRPRPSSIRALAEALGMSPAELPAPRSPVIQPVTPADPQGGPHAGVAIGVLGPLTVHRGRSPASLGGGRHRAVLARLALTPNAAVHVDELIDLLWAEQVPTSSRNLIQTYVSRLRRVLDPHMLALVHNGYRLNARPEQLDLLRFRGLAARGTAHDLDLALELWRGDTDVDELRGSPLWTGLRDEHLAAAIEHARLTQDNPERAIPRLRELVRRHRLHEPLRARLIIALAASGRQAEALASYAEIRRDLADELGIDPSPELAEAHLGVLQQRWRRPPASIAVRSTSDVSFQTPAPPADFTGRADQLRLLGRLLRPAEAMTVCAISGVAGVGKTTLALQAAHAARESFPDGQLYVDLHGHGPKAVTTQEALARFLRALGVPGDAFPVDEDECAALYRTRLAGRRMLVVLDNARDAAHVRPLLPGAGGCAVLVTSRRRLADLAGATLVDLGLFSHAEALDLLASSAGPSRMAAEPEAARLLADACGLLPIALRIAGGRLASRPAWTFGTLLRQLSDEQRRLDELGGVSACFQFSYRELPERTAQAFARLASMPGTDFSAPAAAAFLGWPDVHDVLAELVDGNLLRLGGPDRYSYHDLVRLFAARQAPPDDAAQTRLLDWYLARAAGALKHIYPHIVRLPADAVDENAFADQGSALSWLDDELPAIVAAVEKAAEGAGSARAWQIADQLRGYFFVRRQTQPWIATGEAGLAAARAAGDARAQAAMHQTLGQARWALGHPAEALAEYLQGEALARDSGWLLGAAYLRHNIGVVQAELGRLTEAQESYRQALQLSRRHGFAHVRAVTLNDLGNMCHEQGRLEEAAEYLSEALSLNEGITRRRSALANLSNLGMVLRQLGRFEPAYEYLHEALSAYRRIADEYGEAAVLDELSQLHTHRREHDAAVSAARQGLDLARILGGERAESAALCTLGEALLGAGSVGEARTQFERSDRLASQNSYRYFQTRARIGLALASLEAGDAAQAHDGARLALDAARAGGYRLLEADALVVLARAHLAAGRTHEMARCCQTALSLYRGAGSPLRESEVLRLLQLREVSA